MNEWLCVGRTDASGKIRLPFLPMRRTWPTISVWDRRDGAERNAHFPLTGDPDPEPFTVELK